MSGVVYKIICQNLNIHDAYVGSTKNFKKRMNDHKSKCENPQDDDYMVPVYQFIRSNGGWDNWHQIIIEEVNYSDIIELRIRERYWIETLHSSLNTKIPTRTHKEYREDNKDYISKYYKEWCKKNKEINVQKAKAYYKENKEAICASQKEYRAQNKDCIRA